MRATIEGTITSVSEDAKGEGAQQKKFTELLLLQEGERVQARVRVQGHGHGYNRLDEAQFFGRVMAWGKRSGEADYMLMVE